MSFKSGYVNILGNPNAGKSTLMNKLLGQALSITNAKAQTTRHRILGILNGENYQMVFSDTPGIIIPAYKLHQSMMKVVNLCSTLFCLDQNGMKSAPNGTSSQMNSVVSFQPYGWRYLS